MTPQRVLKVTNTACQAQKSVLSALVFARVRGEFKQHVLNGKTDSATLAVQRFPPRFELGPLSPISQQDEQKAPSHCLWVDLAHVTLVLAVQRRLCVESPGHHLIAKIIFWMNARAQWDAVTPPAP